MCLLFPFTGIPADELYFITLVLKLLILPHGILIQEWTQEVYHPEYAVFFDYKLYLDKRRTENSALLFTFSDYYFTIALTATSPSTATITTPAGTLIEALLDVITVLATT